MKNGDIKKPLIVITGPTASGKTAMAIEYAQRNNCEIVNADSMQVYKHMNIGTAKPSISERGGIMHYLIDEIEPTEKYSVAQYTKAAHRYIQEIHSKGKTPLLVGGTGLYIDSVVKNIQYSKGGIDEEYRNYLRQIAIEKGKDYLHEMLRKIDLKSSISIHPSDVKRIIRALEVYRITGETITEQKNKSQLQGRLYNAKTYAIELSRDVLYSRINQRVEEMFAKGLDCEVLSLYRMGITAEMTAMQGIGYKETVHYIKGNATLEETKKAIAQNTRRYAKRQLTWLRKNNDIIWIRGQAK